MLKKISGIAIVLASLTACAQNPPPAAAVDCAAELKKIDAAILGAYTKLTPEKFDAATAARENLANVCATNGKDADAVNAAVAAANAALK